MTQGIILAGGMSSRAHTNKLLLEINHKPLICHAIDGMRPFVDEIIVVTGRFHKELINVLKDVKVVENKEYEKGMFSSVVKGVKNVSSDFFVLPGDTPFVSKSVYESLLKGNASIRVPSYNNKTGHPVFFKKENIEQILKENIDSNLREYMSHRDVEIIDVDDPYCLKDIDTIHDFKEITVELERN